MAGSILLPKPYPKSHSTKQSYWQRYLFLGLLANATFGILALLYLKTVPPTYTSHSAITLPEAGAAANVNLPNIGQASYESSSLYASTTQDPRENYKFIAQSEPVLSAAASHLNIPLAEFGKPRVKIIDGTTIMTIDFRGATPEEARNKSLAFYHAFEVKLNELRSEEAIRRESSFQNALSDSWKKLEVAQQRLSNYKTNSGLNSNDQLKDLSNNIEQLRKQKVEILAQQQQASARLSQLSASLNLSDLEAVDAFTLQTDQIFQQNLKDYSEASATLSVLGAKFLPDNPQLVAQKAQQDAAQTALLSRSQYLLGKPVSQTVLHQLSLNSNSSDSARESLFQQLVTTQAEQKGFQAQAQATDEQITQLQNRLNQLAQKEANLDALQRDLQVNEAVFSSTLTRLDIGKSNAFGSYPLVQFVTQPSLPETVTWPQKEFVLAGVVLASVFATTGIALFGIHQYRKTVDVRASSKTKNS
jgi:uncharacterized protein involved in exopolysaccharide biosynthesis